MPVELDFLLREAWLFVVAYFPLGVVGSWRWGVWLIKKAYAMSYRPEAGTATGSVAVVTPVYNEDPATFKRALSSWQDNDVDEVIAVIDYTDTACIAVFKSMAQRWSGARLIVTHTPGKRPALADGIRAATSQFVALVDSDTIWARHVKRNALVPFRDPRVGGVATRQSVLHPITLAQLIFNAQLNQRYFEELPFMMARGGRVVTCLSGRTAFYRRATVLPLLEDLLHETFWGQPVISGDDKCLTYLVERRGWKVAFQQNAQVYTPGAPDFPRFFKQRLRWTRNSWRADLRALTQGWVWHHPRFAAYLVDRTVQPFAQLLSPLFFLVSLSLGLWIQAIVLLGWWHVGRALRLMPHLRQRPRDTVLVPVLVVVNFYTGLMKIYALATLNRQGWITRWDADRLPLALPWLRSAGGYAVTAAVVGLLAVGVVTHERRAQQSVVPPAPPTYSTRLASWAPSLVASCTITTMVPTPGELTPEDNGQDIGS